MDINFQTNREERLDLRNTDLTTANLRAAYLVRADLEGANLRGADLVRADLEGAILIGADLIGANLEGADLTRANLTGADLTDTNLTDTDLRNANLTDADLRNAHLEDTSLEGADLTRASLEGAFLEGANLEGADLTGANLINADLINAILINADLTGAIGLHTGYVIVPPLPPTGVAFEVHNAFTTFQSKQTDYLAIITQSDFEGVVAEFPQFVEDTFKSNITELFPGDDNKLEQFKSVFNKSKGMLGSLNHENLQLIYKSITFAFSQDKDFKEQYIITFLDET